MQENPAAGWWEKYIGPGCALDTDKFFIICANVVGGCYGTRYSLLINWFCYCHDNNGAIMGVLKSYMKGCI